VVWLLRDSFQAIPLELEESAMIDGASKTATELWDQALVAWAPIPHSVENDAAHPRSALLDLVPGIVGRSSSDFSSRASLSHSFWRVIFRRAGVANRSMLDPERAFMAGRPPLAAPEISNPFLAINSPASACERAASTGKPTLALQAVTYSYHPCSPK
jgi:hypothetical protein